MIMKMSQDKYFISPEIICVKFGNENPLGEDSLPFCNLYTRNPIGLTHCAVEGLINLYPMEWMSLINGFGCLSCLITWSHPLIMTAGSELGKQLPITMYAASEPCVHVHMCNYVHTRKPVVPALLYELSCMF